MENSCDVLVMGGGPAGATVAARLVRQGWKVVVLEKDIHPRFHIGESLLPLSLPYLEELGVLDEVERIGLRKYAVEFHSMYHQANNRFDFEDAIDPNFPYSYEVRRSEFDHILLKNAAANGAEVHEGWQVKTVDLDGDAIRAVTATAHDGQSQRWTARFYVDATGRDTLMADTLKVKQRNRRHTSAALYGHFSGAARQPGKHEGNICIHWFDHGWFWLIPLKDGALSVGAVCWPAYMKTRKVPVEQFFFDTIALCPAVAERLKGATLTSEVTATGNYSYQSSRMSGSNYVMLGDSFAFIDPVFSSGVHLALCGAFRGAEAIDTILRDPASTARVLKQLEKQIRGGLNTFSWFIYRVTSPAMRYLFLFPRNVLGVKPGIVSLLAGDLFRSTPLRKPILVFRAIYYITTLSLASASWRAFRQRQRNIAA